LIAANSAFVFGFTSADAAADEDEAIPAAR
jgi:hypothetical protein